MEALLMGVESRWLPMSPRGRPESNEGESDTYGDRARRIYDAVQALTLDSNMSII
jgi:hypothetical protein